MQPQFAQQYGYGLQNPAYYGGMLPQQMSNYVNPMYQQMYSGAYSPVNAQIGMYGGIQQYAQPQYYMQPQVVENDVMV